MPQTDIHDLPDSARLWIFVADRPVTDATPLLAAVDAHLAQWAAHGVPLRCARDWRDDHFLAIAVDEAATGASGCSIDGIFRVIARTQSALGADLLASGRVAWRDMAGTIRVTPRADVEALAVAGTITPATPVYETVIDTVGAWRHHFVRPARESWAAALLPPELQQH
ncbi:MAG: hypothetical protein IT355_05875 [Gemmatimonadaceae bacterium]|nr:hypothetical protein [Gemmatimonadaceae bacterium]